MARSRRLLPLVVLLALPIAGCSSGDECDRCEADADCKAGLFCSTFDDGSRRCGSGTGTTTCRVR
jgi:hypothetical protein